jgi:hypothetical protein
VTPLRDARLVYDRHQLLLLCYLPTKVRTPQIPTARAQILLPQSIGYSYSIDSPHTSSSISVSPKILNDTTAFYEFPLSSIFSTSVQSHMDTLARRGERRHLSRENKIRNFGTTTHGELLFLFWYLLHTSLLQATTHTDIALLPCILSTASSSFFLTHLHVASRSAVESAGCSRIFHAYDTLSFRVRAYRGYSTFSYHEAGECVGMAWMISID